MEESERQRVKKKLSSEKDTIVISSISSTSRIARNTLFLYFRQILIMIVSLYTVRVVLATLGAEDYGIYNVVAGVVMMFSCLSGAMATASQRYFSFAMGNGGKENLEKIFSATLVIYAILALAIIVLSETVGFWFVSTKLIIPKERMTAAKWIYQCSVLSFLFTSITTPYISVIISHENMKVYAYISIVDAILKLAVVLVLKIGKGDKLILYGILLLCVVVVNTSLYRLYCRKHYSECRFTLMWNKEKFHEIFNFTGWTLFGQFTSIIRNQAVTVLVNQFFTPVIVAARGLAQQVTNAVSVFSSNFNTSLHPPIIKEYSAGNKSEMLRLVYNGSKITFFLMWIFTLPLVLHLDFILSLWLKNVPEWVSLFTRLSLIDVLINSLSFPLQTVARAFGKMRTYELTLGIMQLLIFFISFVLFLFGFAAWTTFAVSIAVTILMMIARLLIIKRQIGFSIKNFLTHVIFPLVLVCAFSFVIADALFVFVPNTTLLSILQIPFCLFETALCMYFIGMDKNQREKIKDITRKKNWS